MTEKNCEKNNGNTEQSGNSFRTSRYNHFFTEKKDAPSIIAYNAFSNSFATIDEGQFEIIRELLESGGIIPEGSDEKRGKYKKMRDDLRRGGFLLDDTIDEVEVLKAQTRIGRFANNALMLTIAPTLKCNFKCTYCFEKNQAETMSPKVEEALIKFVEEQLMSRQGLYVSWFGGEPLLELDAVERLSNTFDAICKKQNALFPPSYIVTNGYLLTRETAERLKKANIHSAQVTLDGIPKIHNQRRKLVSGGNTFDRILENIKAASQFLKIHLRVNVDKDNIQHLEEFYKLLAERGAVTDNIVVYLAPVFPSEGSCADLSGNCIGRESFSHILVEESIRAGRYGISLTNYPALFKNGFCIADKLNGYVVAPSGLLFKCWEQISSDEKDSVGNILSKGQTNRQIMNNVGFLNWDPILEKKCSACNVFPICGGGCVLLGVKGKGNINRCSHFKYKIEDTLRLKYRETLTTSN